MPTPSRPADLLDAQAELLHGEGRRPRDDAQRSDLGERADQFFRQAVAEVLAVAVGAQVAQGQHGDRAAVERRGRLQREGGPGVLAIARLQLPPQLLELVADVERRLEAPRALFAHAVLDDALELTGNGRVEIRHRDGLGVHDGHDQVRRALRLEGALAGRHLVEHLAQREDVRAGVDGLALELLRRHVGERSAAARLLAGHRRNGGVRAIRPRRRAELCEAEVDDPRPAVVSQHDVAGLEVPVHDAALVGGMQGVGERDRQLEEALEREPAAGNGGRQALTLHVLHGEERHAVGLVDRVDLHDVRVVQGGHRHRLALEASETRLVPGQRVGQELDGDRPVEGRVDRLPDDTHPAGPDLLDESIVRDDQSSSERQSLPPRG